MLAIDIASRKPGIHELTLHPTPEDLELEPDAFSDITVQARLDQKDDRILVMLDAEATAVLECDRTLVEFDQKVQGTHMVLFAPPSFAEAAGDAYDDVLPLLPADTEIDVTKAVRDTILLAIPVRRIAPGAEDIELPTQFGEPVGEEAVDPRWEALRGLHSGDDT